MVMEKLRSSSSPAPRLRIRNSLILASRTPAQFLGCDFHIGRYGTRRKNTTKTSGSSASFVVKTMAPLSSSRLSPGSKRTERSRLSFSCKVTDSGGGSSQEKDSVVNSSLKRNEQFQRPASEVRYCGCAYFALSCRNGGKVQHDRNHIDLRFTYRHRYRDNVSAVLSSLLWIIRVVGIG